MMDLNLSLWIERRALDIGFYANHILTVVRGYEAEIAHLRAEQSATVSPDVADARDGVGGPGKFLVKRLQNPPFGTETSERNLMSSAATRIAALESDLIASQRGAAANYARAVTAETRGLDAAVEAQREVIRLEDALTAERAKTARLMEAFLECIDLLRSARSIAERKGASTNWEAFQNRVSDAVNRHHELSNEVRAALAACEVGK